MKNKINKSRLFPFSIVKLLLIIFAITLTYENALASNERSFIELTKSSHSETLNDVYTFGLYSAITGKSKLRFYAGMQFMEFEQQTPGEDSSTIKILIGQTFGRTIAPFYEIGTDLFGFLLLLDNNSESGTCFDEHQCELDFYFRIGMRINLNDNLMLGLFHENVDFGDFHSSLTGEHRYVGASLGFQF